MRIFFDYKRKRIITAVLYTVTSLFTVSAAEVNAVSLVDVISRFYSKWKAVLGIFLLGTLIGWYMEHHFAPFTEDRCMEIFFFVISIVLATMILIGKVAVVWQ